VLVSGASTTEICQKAKPNGKVPDHYSLRVPKVWKYGSKATKKLTIDEPLRGLENVFK